MLFVVRCSLCVVRRCSLLLFFVVVHLGLSLSFLVSCFLCGVCRWACLMFVVNWLLAVVCGCLLSWCGVRCLLFVDCYLFVVCA